MVHVTSRLNIGGLAQQVLALCAGLDQRGVECTLITGEPGDKEGDMLWFANPPRRIVRIPELGRAVKPMSDFVAFWKLLLCLRALRPDVVHTHAAKAGALGRIAAVLAGVPVRIHSYHGHVFRGYFPPLVSRAVCMVERLLGWMTTALVTPCESQRREIAEEFRVAPPRKVRVARYGIPVEDFSSLPPKAKAREKLGVGEDVLVVGAVGRMVPIKNHALLVDAFGRLPERIGGRRVELLLVGKGDCLPGIEKQIEERGVAARVRFHPWLEDLRWAYGAMDVMALTSRNEGMPIALIEAMAAGVPVVSTAVGGVVDLVKDGETGVLVPGQDPAAFAAALENLLTDSESRARLAQSARDFVRAHHRVENLVQDTLDLYRDLVVS